MITTTAEALTDTANPAQPIELPDGLTVQDALRIAEAVNSTLAESTRRVYDLGWKRWERWCATRGIPTAPGVASADLRLPDRRASDGASGPHPGPRRRRDLVPPPGPRLRRPHRRRGGPAGAPRTATHRRHRTPTPSPTPRRRRPPPDPRSRRPCHCQGCSRRRDRPARLRLRPAGLRARRPDPRRRRVQARRSSALDPPVQDRPGSRWAAGPCRPRISRLHRPHRGARRLAGPPREPTRAAVHRHAQQARHHRTDLRDRGRPHAPQPRS